MTLLFAIVILALGGLTFGAGVVGLALGLLRLNPSQRAEPVGLHLAQVMAGLGLSLAVLLPDGTVGETLATLVGTGAILAACYFLLAARRTSPPSPPVSP